MENAQNLPKTANAKPFLEKLVKIKKYFGVVLEVFFGERSAEIKKRLASTNILLLTVFKKKITFTNSFFLTFYSIIKKTTQEYFQH